MSEERTTPALKESDFEVNFAKSPSRLRKTVHSSSFFFGVIRLLVERSVEISRGTVVERPDGSPDARSEGSLSVEKDSGRGGTAGVLVLDACAVSLSLIELFIKLVEVRFRSKPGLRRFRCSDWSSEDCEPSASAVRSFARFEECLLPRKDLLRCATLRSAVGTPFALPVEALVLGGDGDREREGDDGLEATGDLKLKLCENSLVAEVR